MPDKYLYDQLAEEFGRQYFAKIAIPACVKGNLSPAFELRPYQVDAFQRFICYFENDFRFKQCPSHLLFNMATGSGKTLIMAGLILYLYEKGYRNFLFFVNSTNIIEKTKDNFLNPASIKYLFNQEIHIGNHRVHISPVENFEAVNSRDINICFTTIQKLHSDLTAEKENALTYEDFRKHRVVLIADEAHHINVKTKGNGEMFESWEDTVERIFAQNEGNLLLEFTATHDYETPAMVEKYRNKVIIRYDLVQFRNDRYSKDVVIVQSDFGLGERILQALILSQYKKEVAAKYRINLKPVILFKAQRTIAQSQENKASFHRLIEGLTARDIENIRRKSDIGLVRRAFAFFDAQGITSAQLAERLKHDFKEDFCLSVNDDKEKEKYQILLNTLEDKNNRVRAIFSVQKLSEGWDVLNLFDIVRCYESRDSGRAKLGSATISEAQLIGRGARYFPFTVPENDDRFRRKFDGDLEHELRMLEELHYHSINDSRYILEIRAALIERGMMDDRTVERKMMLKDSFKKSRFYLEGPIFVNSRQRKDYQRITSLSALGVSTRNITHVISSGHGGENRVLAGERQRPLIMEEISKDVRVKDIGYHLIYSALARNPFFTFGSLRKYFPRLDSMRTFITSQDYLGGLEITFRGNIYKLEEDKADVMVAVTELLKQIEKEILGQITEYEGATEFGRKPVCLVFKDKTLKLDKTSERGRDDEQFEHFISGKDWFAFNTLYGTSEEKAFVRMLDRQMERLRVEYDTIYLLRNEGHFAIYNFRDGQAFQPDFVLFLRKKGGEMLAYQLFIEPKGKFIQKYDKWKEDFLRELTEKCADMLKIDGDAKYRLIGVPFYNNEEENEFRKSLEGALNEPSRGNGNHSNRGNPPKELSLAPGKKS